LATSFDRNTELVPIAQKVIALLFCSLDSRSGEILRPHFGFAAALLPS
jgi:hypothetical protein